LPDRHGPPATCPPTASATRRSRCSRPWRRSPERA
jgi:hypothetical protein